MYFSFASSGTGPVQMCKLQCVPSEQQGFIRILISVIRQ